MPRAKAPASLTKADYELLAEFRYTLRKFLGFSEAVALKHDVTPQQYQGLLAIQGYPGRDWVTIGEFAEQMHVAHHSAVGLIDRMEALKLVRRAAGKEDRRQVQVRLTPKGLGVLEKLYRAHREELQSVGPQLVGLLRRATTAARPIAGAVPVGPEDHAGYASPACSMPEIEDKPAAQPSAPDRDSGPDDVEIHLR